jgi:hypothetical protein
MGPQNWDYITLNYFKTVPSCSNKGGIDGECEKKRYLAIMWRSLEAHNPPKHDP